MLYRALTIPLFCSIASASAFAFAFASASASAWQQHQHDPSALGDSTGQAFKTPGDNDLDFCDNPKNYSFDMDYLDVRPNPPVASENVTIQTEGTLSTDFDAANIHLTVKWGYVTLISDTFDLCEATDVEPDCPLRKGHLTGTKKFEIPSNVPPGKYTVTADVQAEGKDGEQITCVQGTVMF